VAAAVVVFHSLKRKAEQSLKALLAL